LSALPVDRVLCTAHEGKGEDEITKRTVFGPAIAGKAANDKVAQWFGCTLHHESYTQKTGPDAAVSGVRAYFARHPDSELGNVFWPAKLDAPPRVKAAIMRRWPGNYVPLTIDEKGESMSDVSDLLRMLDANSMVEVEARVPVVNTTRKGKR
jgi:hypothetical protein